MKIFEKIKNRNRRNEEIEMIERNPSNRNFEVDSTNSTDMITYNYGYEGHDSSASLGIDLNISNIHIAIVNCSDESY